MNFVIPDFLPAAAELYVVAVSFVMLLVSAFKSEKTASAVYKLAQLALWGAVVITVMTLDGKVAFTFSNMFVDDLMGDFLKFVTYIAVSVALVYSRSYLQGKQIETSEYYLLVVYATLGMMVMISANHFLTVYIGLELLSLSLYGLVAIDRDNSRSTEAAMKYFVLGALASGMLLYGISMVYGATGTLEITGVAQALFHQSANGIVLLFGLIFIIAGLAFKLGLVPFHMWIPDVYHGAPTSVTLLIGSAPKLAGFAIALRILVNGLFEFADQWQSMLMVLAVLSIIIGNLAAIAQTNIKRMLAYSAISHMGFMVLGLAAGVVGGDKHFALNAYSSALFYVVAYVLQSLASFGLVLLMSKAGLEAENLSDYKGLNKRSPWFAGMMLIVMFSMAGVPFFVGFFAKLSVLQATIAAGYFEVALIAVVMSMIGAFYYLRVVKVMYFDDPDTEESLQHAPELKALLSFNGLAIALFGLMPQTLMSICAFVLLGSL